MGTRDGALCAFSSFDVSIFLAFYYFIRELLFFTVILAFFNGNLFSWILELVVMLSPESPLCAQWSNGITSCEKMTKLVKFERLK